MKGFGKGTAAMLLAAALSISMAFGALADEVPKIEIPVEITLEGSVPSAAEEFQVVLKANDAGCPMPEGSVDGAYTMTMVGDSTGNLPAISFPRVGVYGYTIYQEPGTHDKGTYDETVYQVTVYVTNKEGGGVETAVVMHVDGVEAKPGSVQFTDSYQNPVPSGGGNEGGGGSGGGRGDGGSSSGGPGVVPDNLVPIDANDVPLAGIMDGPVPLIGMLPKTGDTTNLMLWAALMVVSAGGLAGLMVLKKRMD